MKKINVIDVIFAEKKGIQDLYETLDECEATGRETNGVRWSLNNNGTIGMVFSDDNDFISVISGFDKYEILD